MGLQPGGLLLEQSEWQKGETAVAEGGGGGLLSMVLTFEGTGSHRVQN